MEHDDSISLDDWWERFQVSLSPATIRNMDRHRRVFTWQLRVWNRWFPWMNTSFMHYITGFWVGLIEDGPRSMLKPRWGGITFGWLNDGMKPTVWHTLYSLFFPRGKYSAIYPDGAPHSLAEARRLDCEWQMRRLSDGLHGCANPREHTNRPWGK